MERRLGRGLETLLGGAKNAADEGPASNGPAPSTLPIIEIRPNPEQPRKVFESAPLEELRDSIQRHGLLQPICVRPSDRGYEIVAGERRWRAARMAGLTEIPAVVLENATDERLLELALVENLQRQDLDPLEKARAFQELQVSFSLTQAEVAERVGMRRPTVTNHLRLLELPKEAQDAVAHGLISMGHAKALLPLKEPEAIRSALVLVVKKDLSVRQLEEFVKDSAEGEQDGEPSASLERHRGGRLPAWVRDLEGRMRDNLGTRVSIQNRSGYKGQIVIRYHDREELDRLCGQLAPKDEIG